MKRCNRKTKAYKMGHSAGLADNPNNNFAHQSTRWVDYEQGYQDGASVCFANKGDSEENMLADLENTND